MDVFCKETQSLGGARDYKVDMICKKVPSPLPANIAAENRSVTVVSPITTTKKGKKPSALKRMSESRSTDAPESSTGQSSPLPLTTGASNGTVRQIQNMLQNRSSNRIQAQADSTVSSSPLSIPNLTGAVPPPAAVSAAASIQAAAALQQSTFLGVPAVFQAPVGASPLVMSGNQIPILQPQDVVLQNQQIGAPPQLINPNLPTSPLPFQGVRAQLPTNPTAKPTTSRNEQPPQQPATPPSSVLPPLTIIVPHPIFVPIPIPVPVPIPIRAEAYDAVKTAVEAEQKPPKQKHVGHKSVVANGRNPLRESDEGKSRSLINLSALDNLPPENQNQSVLHDRVRILRDDTKKPGSSQKNRTPNLLLSSFPASNGLHRSASLDLGVASRSSTRKSALHRHHGHKVRTQLVMVGEDTSAIHDERESSRKVREVLRVHLNKRISQSALNLAELSHASSDGEPLRRSHSLSRLRESSINPDTSLDEVGNNQSTDSKEKGPNKKPRRVLDKRNRIEEDIEMERELMIHEEDPVSEVGEEEDREEPTCKRKKWTNDADDSS